MSDFDPYLQSFTLLKEDGQTPLRLSVRDVNALYQENLGTCTNYGSQIGASFVMLLTLVAMTPSIKLVKVSLWIHILALVSSTVRMTLLSVYFTSNWANFYSYWAEDYSRITPADFHRSIATETLSLILLILVQASLGIQAWAMVNLLPGRWKWFFTGLSGFVSLITIAWRVALSVVQIKAILSITQPNPGWVAYYSTIVGAVSIFYYCALFNIKLLIHLITNRGILPSRNGLNAMGILVITNGLLMTIPAVFAALEWGHWTNFESGSVTYTSVIVFLPMGTLVASRVSGSASQVEPQRSCCTAHSSTPLKMASTSALGLRGYGSAHHGVVMAHIESATSHFRHGTWAYSDGPIRAKSHISSDPEEGTIRVNREVQLFEERI